MLSLPPSLSLCLSLSSMRQAQASVLVGLKKLQELDIPTQRPDDYFAEMIKTDDHMRKVRERVCVLYYFIYYLLG